MKLSKEAMDAAKRIAAKNGVSVQKVLAAYQKAARPKAKLNAALLFLDK